MQSGENFIIWAYLDKNYLIKDGVLIYKPYTIEEKASDIIISISSIFSIEIVTVENAVKDWVYDNGMTYKDWSSSRGRGNLFSLSIVAGLTEIHANWDPILAQDLNAFHNIDAEAELTAMLTEEIAAEIDREILRNILNIGIDSSKCRENKKIYTHFEVVETKEPMEIKKNSPYWEDWLSDY